MKPIVFLLLLCLFFFVLAGSIACHAENTDLPSISLPSELADYLGKLPTQSEQIAQWWSSEKLLLWGKRHLSDGIDDMVGNFLCLLSVVALSSVVCTLSESVHNKGVVNAFQYMAILGAATSVLDLLRQVYASVETHISTVCTFVSGIVPVYTGICTASGLGGLSLASGSGLLLAISFAALLSAQVLLPLLRVSFLFGFSASVSDLPGISQIAASVRRFFVGVIGGISALLCAVFVFQTEITAKADSLAGRTVRYIASTTLPLVGNALSETSRTLSGAFSLMGSVVGGAGVAVIVMLILPILLRLFLLRLCFQAAAGMADILSLPRIAALYRESGALLGALMAILAIMDTVLIFEFAVLLRIG